MDVTLAQWDTIFSAQRESIARTLSKQLPEGFMFVGLHPHRCGEAEREVAMYSLGGSRFAFVPGGTFTLGFDVGDWQPNSEEVESYLTAAADSGIEASIHEYVGTVTLRPRSVVVPGLLVEVEPRELGWNAISLDDPEVREMMREYGSRATVESSRGSTSTRIRPGSDGIMIAERAYTRTHGDFAAELKADGFRFPTSDEWEYLCGAGESTLFRWGNHMPRDRQRDEPDSDRVMAECFPHERPNAFGLMIASNSYHSEMVAELGRTRGGDGGVTACGGGGAFLETLILATSWFDEDTCRFAPEEPIIPGYFVGRRVLELR